MQTPTITIQAEKGSELSWLEADANFMVLREMTKNWVQHFTQTSHGLFVGDVVRNVSGSWVRARANSLEGASALGVVVGTPDANSLVIVFSGLWDTGSTDYLAGQTLYLSEQTAGLIVTTPPDGFRKVVGIAIQDGLVFVNAAQTPVIPNPNTNQIVGGLVGQFAFQAKATAPTTNAVILWQRGDVFTVSKNEVGSYNLSWTQPLDDTEYSISVAKDRSGQDAGGWSIQGARTVTSIGLLFEKDNEILDGHVNYDPNIAIVSIFGRKSA